MTAKILPFASLMRPDQCLDLIDRERVAWSLLDVDSDAYVAIDQDRWAGHGLSGFYVVL